MPGKKRGYGLMPGRKALRAQQDRALKVAAGLDRMEDGLGERLCQELAVAISTTVGRAIRSSESERVSEPKSHTY